jgi:hypothetical protein
MCLFTRQRVQQVWQQLLTTRYGRHPEQSLPADGRRCQRFWEGVASTAGACTQREEWLSQRRVTNAQVLEVSSYEQLSVLHGPRLLYFVRNLIRVITQLQVRSLTLPDFCSVLFETSERIDIELQRRGRKRLWSVLNYYPSIWWGTGENQENINPCILSLYQV